MLLLIHVNIPPTKHTHTHTYTPDLVSLVGCLSVEQLVRMFHIANMFDLMLGNTSVSRWDTACMHASCNVNECCDSFRSQWWYQPNPTTTKCGDARMNEMRIRSEFEHKQKWCRCCVCVCVVVCELVIDVMSSIFPSKMKLTITSGFVRNTSDSSDSTNVNSRIDEEMVLCRLFDSLKECTYILYCTVLYCIVWYCIVLYGMIC